MTRREKKIKKEPRNRYTNKKGGRIRNLEKKNKKKNKNKNKNKEIPSSILDLCKNCNNILLRCNCSPESSKSTRSCCRFVMPSVTSYTHASFRSRHRSQTGRVEEHCIAHEKFSWHEPHLFPGFFSFFLLFCFVCIVFMFVFVFVKIKEKEKKRKKDAY